MLSALGCGAYRNPPKEVAEIFASVIQQYSPRIKKVCFAVVNDHNSRPGIQSNFSVFQKHLHLAHEYE